MVRTDGTIQLPWIGFTCTALGEWGEGHNLGFFGRCYLAKDNGAIQEVSCTTEVQKEGFALAEGRIENLV